MSNYDDYDDYDDIENPKENNDYNPKQQYTNVKYDTDYGNNYDMYNNYDIENPNLNLNQIQPSISTFLNKDSTNDDVVHMDDPDPYNRQPSKHKQMYDSMPTNPRVVNGKYYYPLKATEVNVNTKYDDITNFDRAEKAGVTFGGKTKRKRQRKSRKNKSKSRKSKKNKNKSRK